MVCQTDQVLTSFVYLVLQTTPLFPETSYGTAKAITELYAFDYARKNFVDTRILRLPTVAIRAGAPSSAASSFISGMIREPLQGLPSECPVATGLDDTALDTVPIYLSRAITVFDNSESPAEAKAFEMGVDATANDSASYSQSSLRTSRGCVQNLQHIKLTRLWFHLQRHSPCLRLPLLLANRRSAWNQSYSPTNC